MTEEAAETTPPDPTRPVESPPPAGETGPPPEHGSGDSPHSNGAGFGVRYQLIRPRTDRRLAGVCAAMGHATSTDPLLWRVLFAVLGVFGGVGVLLYAAAWLSIPAEGDTASPLESLLGRGRSSMSPRSVFLLSILVLITLAAVITDSFRTALLAAAILIGGMLLLNRQGTEPGSGTGFSIQRQPVPPPTAGPNPPTSGSHPAPAGFAPYGPYVSPPFPPPPPPPAPRPPRPPREPSPLGAVTFSLVFLVAGVLAMLDLAGVLTLTVSVYLVVTLGIIAVGLLVGAWFGRARWLIALGLATTAALGIVTLDEAYAHRDIGDIVTWAPRSHAELQARYENKFGNSVLDLRAVDFTHRDSQVTVTVSLGRLTVLVPPEVDVTTITDVKAGNAAIFGNRLGRIGGPPQEYTDFGADGPGGGKLSLNLHIKAGELEVTR